MLYYIELKIIEELDADIVFRSEIGLALGISERAIYNTVKKYLKEPFANSVLTKIAAIEFLESKGYSKEDILTTEQPAAS